MAESPLAPRGATRIWGHLWMILGVFVVVFPVYYVFIASTHSTQTILRPPLPEALAELGRRGLTRVFCEGGGQLAAGLLREGLVDEIVGYTAGVVLGGDGRRAVGSLGLAALADAPRFRLVETCDLDGDIVHRWAARP